jgi:hypothetical protein
VKRVTVFSFLLALLFAGCRSASRDPDGLEAVKVADAPKLAPPPRDFKAPHAGAIPELSVLGAPETARTYASFRGVRVGMPLTDVIMLCGLPDGDWGGIGGPPSHILIWDLKDGSWVRVKSDGLQVVEDISREYPIRVR